jgi:hypothetical protein
MRAAEQAEERRRAAEQAAVSARAQEQARKAAAAEERRQKLEAEVQVRLPAEMTDGCGVLGQRNKVRRFGSLCLVNSCSAVTEHMLHDSSSIATAVSKRRILLASLVKQSGTETDALRRGRSPASVPRKPT